METPALMSEEENMATATTEARQSRTLRSIAKAKTQAKRIRVNAQNATESARLHAERIRVNARKAKDRARLQALKVREKANKVSNVVTQSRAFKKLVDWAYGVCDTEKNNHVSSDQLYSGLLLVHLYLAKFCGSAACMPPSRQTVQELFEACDVDDSGGIDREEFDIIVKVTCAQIFSRVLINYATLILVIPFAAQILVDRYVTNRASYLETVCEQFTGTFLFVLIVPLVWKTIDQFAHQEAWRQAEHQKSTRNLMARDGGRRERYMDTIQYEEYYPSKKTM